ncbi:hypothetical protein [Fusobacterium periodonticum]|uniref:hypothetical protein n=1 Tax=Fusobacterium periodonticum TaxID=860 RepID=UPI00195CFEED|nr:hypothetical protein [Fusobacterium periodonticum]VTX76779.1 Chromosome partition protein Smc [Fusobacterium periodonticum]
MPGGIVTDRMDNRNIEDRDLKKRIELLEKNLEDTKDDLIDTKNTLKKIVPDLTKLIDDKIKNYMGTLNSNNSNEKYQTELVEPGKIENNNVEKSEEEKEKKLDISKFIEAFLQEFSFIDKEQFNDEMENDEIMGNIIEKIKSAFVSKDDEIENKTKEIVKLNIKKNELESDIETLSSNMNKKENENKLLESKKVGLERSISELNHKVNELENLKGNLEINLRKLSNDKNELENNLNIEKGKVNRLEEIERILTNERIKLEKEKRELEEKDKENSKKMEIFMKKFEEKENELKSIGSLLEAKKIYDKYLSIETRILSKLDNVLIQRDFESFISSGYTLSSLDNVWDIVKIEYKNISSKDKEILKEVFAFFLAQINKRFKEAKYGLVQVEVGEDFDAVNQVDLSQNSRGIVTECVFYGYGFLAEKENPNEEDVITRRIKNPLVLTV